MPHSQHVLSLLTRDGTWVLTSESAESQPLDHQGNSHQGFFFLIAFLKTGFGGFVGQAGQHVGC